MKKHYLFLFYLIISISIIGCKNNPTDNIANNAGKSILFEECNLKKSWNFSEVFDSVLMIPLETNDQVLIREITKIQAIGDRFYILDKSIQTIFTFDKQGYFLWKINAIGRGPQEYNRAIDFDINPENLHLYLYANYPQKLMEYDSTGNFITEKRIGINGNSIAVQDGYLSIYSANISNIIDDKQTNSQLIIQNMATDSLTEYLPSPFKDNGHSCLVYQYGEAFQHTKDELLFWTSFHPHIYSITKNQVKVKYTIDFGKHSLPSGLLLKDLDNLKYAYGLNSFWENDKYCFFQCYMNQNSYRFLLNKSNNKLDYGNWKDNLSGNLYPHIVGATDEYMLAYNNAYELFRHDEYWKGKNVNNQLISRLTATIKENNNPVLFLYSFKK